MQEEVKLKQQLLSQNDKLLQSLRVELKMYERLDKEHKSRQQGTGCFGVRSFVSGAASLPGLLVAGEGGQELPALSRRAESKPHTALGAD